MDEYADAHVKHAGARGAALGQRGAPGGRYAGGVPSAHAPRPGAPSVTASRRFAEFPGQGMADGAVTRGLTARPYDYRGDVATAATRAAAGSTA